MKFSELASDLYTIAQEPSRNAMTHMLARLFSRATDSEAHIISYLCLGQLRAVYQSTQFNIGKKTLRALLVPLLSITDTDMKQYIKEYGSEGAVIEHIDWPYEDTGLSVSDVYAMLVHIESISGTGSQEIKGTLLTELLQSIDKFSASLVIRIVLGSLRTGFSDMTLVDAYSYMIAGDKSLKKRIEHAYNVKADIGIIAYTCKQEDPIEKLKDIKPTVGIPIRPAAAERAVSARAVIDKIGRCVAQPKLDGFRVQVHYSFDDGVSSIAFYSRNLQNMSDMFPEINTDFKSCMRSSVIVEGEAIAYERETGSFLPFQQTVKRKRKHNVDQTSQDIPLRLYLFDILYADGSSVMHEPHTYRRRLLKSLFKSCAHSSIFIIDEHEFTTAEGLDAYFNEQITKGLEGLVVKKPHGVYTPGKRHSNWIKLKRTHEGNLMDTLDVVILGYNYGQGKRAQFGIGSLLVGIYNHTQSRFESLAKVGTGFSDNGWKDIKKVCDSHVITEKPHNVYVHKDLYPDVWVDPYAVIEVTADEITQSPLHTALKISDQPLSQGFALRFPRFIKVRPDKHFEQSTSEDEIRTMYQSQYFS
jgi:DNA ligase-1